MKPIYLITLILLLGSCRGKEKPGKPVDVVVDFNKHSFIMPEGDSVFWQEGEWIEDSSISDISFGHRLPLQTRVGLKNLKPLVIITDNDTVRCWLSHDTLRFTTCK